MKRKFIKLPIENLLSRYAVYNDENLKSEIILKKYKVSEWYKNTYSTDSLKDSLKENVTFFDVFKDMANGKNIYDTIGVSDSLIRERLFREMAIMINTDYDIIYYLWLKL